MIYCLFHSVAKYTVYGMEWICLDDSLQSYLPTHWHRQKHEYSVKVRQNWAALNRRRINQTNRGPYS